MQQIAGHRRCDTDVAAVGDLHAWLSRGEEALIVGRINRFEVAAGRVGMIAVEEDPAAEAEHHVAVGLNVRSDAGRGARDVELGCPGVSCPDAGTLPARSITIPASLLLAYRANFCPTPDWTIGVLPPARLTCAFHLSRVHTEKPDWIR